MFSNIDVFHFLLQNTDKYFLFIYFYVYTLEYILFNCYFSMNGIHMSMIKKTDEFLFITENYPVLQIRDNKDFIFYNIFEKII